MYCARAEAHFSSLYTDEAVVNELREIVMKCLHSLICTRPHTALRSVNRTCLSRVCEPSTGSYTGPGVSRTPVSTRSPSPSVPWSRRWLSAAPYEVSILTGWETTSWPDSVEVMRFLLRALRWCPDNVLILGFFLISLWRPLLPSYGFSYKASCARPG